MKLFFTVIILMMLIKGLSYIIAPKFVKTCAEKLVGTPEIQIVTFGWILVLCASAAWFSIVRHMID